MLPTLLGKIEFEMGEEGRERALLDHLLRLAVAATFRDRLAGLDLSGFTAVFAEGAVVETGELVPAGDLLAPAGHGARSGQGAGPARLRRRRLAGQVAAAAEFTLEGLHLTRRIEKDHVDGRTVYGGA